MGNTINPTALRLGWSKGWIDNYFTKELYYPQLLHKILRLRFILICVLNRHWKGRRHKPYLFSHLIINKLVKKLNVTIYFYDNLAYKVWDRFYGRLLPRWSRVKTQMLITFKQKSRDIRFRNWKEDMDHIPKPRNDRIWIKPARLRVFFILVFAYLRFLNRRLAQFSEYILVNWRLLFYYSFFKNPKILKGNFRHFQKNFLHHLLIIHSFFKNSKYSMHFNRQRGFLSVAKTIISNAFTFTWTSAYMKFVKVLLLRLCKNIFLNDFINFNFYRVTHTETNAMFLAKYIAKKLIRGNRLYDVINPIKRELKRRINIRFSKAIKRNVKKLSLNNKKKLFNNFRWKTIEILKNYKRYSNMKYFINKTLVNYEWFLFKYFSRKRKERYLHGKRYYRRKMLIFLCFKTPINSMLLLNNQGLKNSDTVIKQDNYWWIKNMFDDVNNNYSFTSITKGKKITTISSNYNLNDIIFLSSSFFIKYLHMNYTKYLIQWEYNYYHINKRNLRNQPIKNKIKKLLGFKLQLRGRFSRKQIAANHVFQTGNIGLNTIMGNLDYGFATIPLFNSSVGIKVWLNWNKEYIPSNLKVL